MDHSQGRSRAETDLLLAIGALLIVVVLFMDYYGDQDISIATWMGFLSNVGSGLVGLWMGISISRRYQPAENREASGSPKEAPFPEELIGALDNRNPDRPSLDDRRKYGVKDVAA